MGRSPQERRLGVGTQRAWHGRKRFLSTPKEIQRRGLCKRCGIPSWASKALGSVASDILPQARKNNGVAAK